MSTHSNSELKPKPAMENLLLYILTFNCARNPIDIDLVAAHFFHALPPTAASAPHLLVLSLQELAPIAYAFLGGSYLTPYFDAFTQAVARAAADRWHDTQYVRLATDHVGMTALMVFARADIVARIGAVQTARVGLGVQQMGNKGAVVARLTYATADGEQPVALTFVGAHLAPAEEAFERRNRDWRGIVERLVFERVLRTPGGQEEDDEEEEESERAALLNSDSTDASVSVDTDRELTHSSSEQGIFTPAGYLFLAGDLNYRTSNTLPLPDDRARFPRLDTDDPAHPLHYAQLLKHDQLTRERDQGRCFHGLSEAPVTFPPTYKYRIGARDPRDWAWTRTRWPSWCDRVLYLEDRPRVVVTTYGYDALPLFPTSDHRAVALAAAILLQGRSQSDAGGGERSAAEWLALGAPFPIDRDWRRKRDEARRKELVVGGLAYLGLTWEGRRLLLAMVVGGLGAWFVLRSLLRG
ncbi:putative inositol 5-phosphatase [Aspergillus clavatus NRRL 1]|uniref:Inositol 5-phosphatase, putative n=1 Tax=Aspergillus clavatus (strain ATCC 1007 / CBS 513.65 / DSM 816 / NCTC 3887 / NRRL 1 / QM 1276 / 107) TaxID=344612 RepID=A1CA88_ASPCL|nr:inositol 5-phosphatase, putative [Aspergillus clavatus NRRL 1]EAW12656.1 inositol 5-phosphatase, putative [Aspergillus clavatus NRRL 1]